MAAATLVEDQDQLMEKAKKQVQEQAFYMKRSMDQSDLKQALNYAKEMLKELRTAALTPRNYYELYMKVLEELRYLEDFFMTLQRNGTPVADLYKQVQECPMVLPRLYLMVTVGGVYIKSRQVPAQDILKDLVEMTKGVQHPMRGLFLRNYLTQQARDKLPDVGSEYAKDGGGTVNDSIDFIVQNFAETNRLWVRMQSQGPTKNKKKRERERQELRILVGTNLVRLSELEGVDVATYKEAVLPRVLEQVVNCKDTIAQSYLMDCIIHVFPEDFHWATLESFLQTITQLKEKVNVRAILESMMDRLANASEGSQAPEVPSDVPAFQLFNECVTKLLEERTSLDLAEVLRLQRALLNFELKCYPGNKEYVDHCLGQAVSVLTSSDSTATTDESAIQEIEGLLSIPLASLALQVLELPQYSSMLEYLPWSNRKQVAIELVRAVLNSRTALSSAETVQQLFGMIVPLLRDNPALESGTSASGEGDDAAASEDDEELEREQVMVGRLVNLLRSDDTDQLFSIFLFVRKHFGQGGSKRVQYTLPPMTFAALRLVQAVRKLETQDEPPELRFSSRKVFQFMHEMVGGLASAGHAEQALRLFLQCAIAADQCDFKPIAYEYFSQASILYEDELSDSKAQLRCLKVMVGTLMSCRHFTEEDYDTLITKTTQYAAKLLKKPDQCRMVTMCSHLFWAGKEDDELKYRDPRRVLECLQRSLKIADVCMASSMHVNLFVEILNQYLYYFENDNEMITEKYISGLIALINEHIENMDMNDQRSEVEAHYRNTIAHIRGMQKHEKLAEKFSEIVISN